MNLHVYEPFVYLENYRVEKVDTISVSTGVGKLATATVTLPPSEAGSKILPGTRIYIFLKDTDKDEEMFLWFSGETINRPSVGVGIGNKIVLLHCVSDFYSLSQCKVQTTDMIALSRGAIHGANKLVSGSGTMSIPIVSGEMGPIQIFRHLIPSSEKGKLKGKATEPNSQSDDVASYKGKIFALLQTFLLSVPLLHDKLRRTQFLDRLAIHIDPEAVAILELQGADGMFAKNLVAQIFRGNKNGWQILQEYLSLVFHDVVSICPPRAYIDMDIPWREQQYLPKGVAEYINGKSKKKFTMSDYMSVRRDVPGSVMDMMVKPRMVGTFPPQCNVLEPQDYAMFQMDMPVGITRMAVRGEISAGIGNVILRPDPLEQAYVTSIKYAGGKGFQAFSDLLNHQASDYVTNEEKILGQQNHSVRPLNTLITKTLNRIVTKGLDADYQEEVMNYQSKIDEAAKEYIQMAYILNQGVPNNKRLKKMSTEDTIRIMLEARGVPANFARATAKDAAAELGESIAELKEAGQLTAYTSAEYNKSNTNERRRAYDSSLKKYKQLKKDKKADMTVPEKKHVTNADNNRHWIQEAERMYNDARQGSLQVSGRFNLDVVPGFSMMFIDKDGGKDVFAHLDSKTDTINFSSGTATTTYNVSHPEYALDVDFNKVDSEGKFKQKIFGLSKFVWGKSFDYSKLLYRKYLNCKVHIPLIPSKLSPIDYTKLYLDYTHNTPSVSKPSIVFADLTYALLFTGLSVELNGESLKMSELIPEGRIGNKSDIWDNKYFPAKKDLDSYCNGDFREQFYIQADYLANVAEKKYKDNNIQQLLKVLDTKGGRLHYIFDELRPNYEVKPYYVEKFFDDFDMTEKLTKDIPDDNFPYAPRWLGNPGVAFTDLLLSYLSCFEPPLTAKQVWGSDKPASPKDLKKVRSTSNKKKISRKESLKLRRDLVRKLILEIREDTPEWQYIAKTIGIDPKNDGKVLELYLKYEMDKKKHEKNYSKKLADEWGELAKNEGELDKEIASMSKRDTDSDTRAAIDDGYYLGQSPKILAQQKMVQAIADINRHASQLEYILTLGNAKDFDADIDKNHKYNSTPPVPRPLSESEVIEIRRDLVYNMIQELKYYVRSTENT